MAAWRIGGGFAELSARGGGGGVKDPPGYSSSGSKGEEGSRGKKVAAVDAELKQKKAWEVAQAPGKQVGMMAFMMWMSGNGIQIFSIMMTVTGILQPLRAILASEKTFAPFKDPKVDSLLPRLLFCAIQAGGLLVALYKLHAMGLLPTHPSDWVSRMSELEEREISFGGNRL